MAARLNVAVVAIDEPQMAPKIEQQVLDEHRQHPPGGSGHNGPSLTVESVMEADRWARERAAEVLATMNQGEL